MMNFVKKTFAAFCAAVLALGTVTGVLAYESYTLCDDAMLFDSGETQKLEEMMQNLGQKTGWEIVVYTNTNFVDSDDMEYYYNDYYDSEGFSDDCVMLVFDTGYDNRIINTYGDGGGVFRAPFDGGISSARSSRPYGQGKAALQLSAL